LKRNGLGVGREQGWKKGNGILPPIRTRRFFTSNVGGKKPNKKGKSTAKRNGLGEEKGGRTNSKRYQAKKTGGKKEPKKLRGGCLYNVHPNVTNLEGGGKKSCKKRPRMGKGTTKKTRTKTTKKKGNR